jgi:hypothetical protein
MLRMIKMYNKTTSDSNTIFVEFLTINVLLHTKSEQKVISNYICTPIIIKNPLKPGFSIRNIFCVGRVIVYFLLEKQTFNWLLKVIGIQILSSHSTISYL